MSDGDKLRARIPLSPGVIAANPGLFGPQPAPAPKKESAPQKPAETESSTPPGIVKFTIWRVPIGKPRQTRADKWKQRPAVLRYRAWADIARLAAVDAGANLSLTPYQVSWTAFLPIPESWPKKKKAAYAGSLHRQKPDRDNIDKAILDALFTNDAGVAAGTLVKRWDDGHGPRIVIELHYL